MQRFVLTVVLVLTTYAFAFAGDVPSVDFVPPPPPAPSATEGDMGAGGFAETIADEFVLAVFGIFAS